LVKAEINKVKSEHLDLLYGIIKLLEGRGQAAEAGAALDWHEFVANTYGCLSNAPIARGDQGRYELRAIAAWNTCAAFGCNQDHLDQEERKKV
jgi:hypothetical protein